MGVMWKGRELASNQCKVKVEIIDGVEREVLYDIPKSWKKLKYKDEVQGEGEEKKVTYRMSAERGKLLYAILQALQDDAGGANIFKTKAGKYCAEVKEGKWFTVGVTENKKVPADQKAFTPPKAGKALKDNLIISLTETFALFGQVKAVKGGYCLETDNKWFTLTITENRAEPADKKEFNDHREVQ